MPTAPPLAGVARRPGRGATLLSSCLLLLLVPSLVLLGGPALGFAQAADEPSDPPGAPRITAVAVTSRPPTGQYREGDTIEFAVDASAPLTVEPGAEPPTLAVAVDQAVPSGVVHATYLSGSGTDRLVFALRVTADHRDDDGVSVPASAGGVHLNGGRIQGPDGTPLSTALAPGVELPDQPGHRVRAGASPVRGGGRGRPRGATDESPASFPVAPSALQASGEVGAEEALAPGRGRTRGTSGEAAARAAPAAGVPGGTGLGGALELHRRRLLQDQGERLRRAWRVPRREVPGGVGCHLCAPSHVDNILASPQPSPQEPRGSRWARTWTGRPRGTTSAGRCP